MMAKNRNQIHARRPSEVYCIDIAFAVNNVSRFNANYGKANWNAVRQIFRYIKGTMNMKLYFSGSEVLTGLTGHPIWISDARALGTMGGGWERSIMEQQNSLVRNSIRRWRTNRLLLRAIIKVLSGWRKRTVSGRDLSILIFAIITYAIRLRTTPSKFDICLRSKWWPTVWRRPWPAISIVIATKGCVCRTLKIEIFVGLLCNSISVKLFC